MNKIICCLLALAMLFVGGCADYSKYADSQKEQNLAMLKIHNDNIREKVKAKDAHEQRMTVLIQTAITAASQTPDKTDDVLVPMLIMSIEDKRVMAEVIASNGRSPLMLQKIEKPDSFGDTIKKSTGLIVGVGAIALGIVNSNNMADIATAGINGAGNSMTITGDSNRVQTADHGSTIASDNVLGEGAQMNFNNSNDTTQTDDHTDNSGAE